MKKIFTKRHWSLALLVLGLLVFVVPSGLAQSAAAAPQQPPDAGAQQPGPSEDPITQLNLTPQQRQQIRSIRELSRDERAVINHRVQETQKALNQALDADNPDEALIEQRAREAGEAQTASIRLRALTEIRIRRVLTPEQLKTLRVLRAQAQQIRREQRLENRANNVPGRGLPNQRNAIMPAPRRDNLLRRQRP